MRDEGGVLAAELDGAVVRWDADGRGPTGSEEEEEPGEGLRLLREEAAGAAFQRLVLVPHPRRAYRGASALASGQG